MPAVSADRLTKTYAGKAVVDRVSFSIPAGECVGVLGPNGAGKTTMLRMLIGATPASGGRLRVLGEPVPARAREARMRIGVLPQQDNLDPDFTVAENLRVYAGYFGLRGRRLDRRIDELLEFCRLETRAGARIDALSGGMRRRLSLARALINEPELLILDEPTTGLDPQARHLIWRHLNTLRRQGMTLILTTHYMEEAARLCGRVLIMDDGRIIEEGAPRTLIGSHIEPHVIELHGDRAQAWHDAHGAGLRVRLERAGDTLLYYTTDERPLLEMLHAHPSTEFLHRPANLEDVFLKLTGKDLRD